MDYKDEINLSYLFSWFENYVNKFKSTDKNYNQNINLKKEHTYRVCSEIARLGKSLNLNKEDLNLAKTIALLHDVGRFEQYDRYHTFADAKSEDHAQLGVKIIRQKNVLQDLNPSTRDLILCTISYHNRPALPENETDKCLFLTKLLRDADKLDILYVVTDYYQNGSESPNESLELELPDNPQISDEVYNDLILGRTVNAQHIQTLNDFKLLQMAWIYDVNFPLTFQLIRKRRYLKKIRDALPHSEEIQKVYSTVKSYLDKNCKLHQKIQNA